MGIGDPLEISGSELVHILRTPSELFASGGCIVLDCRPFLAFSRTHILESRNVNWNSMLRRRSKSSVVSLEWLVADKALLAQLRNGDFSPVVVLDDNSRSVRDLKSESLASLLISALQLEVQSASTHICFLQGKVHKTRNVVIVFGEYLNVVQLLRNSFYTLKMVRRET